MSEIDFLVRRRALLALPALALSLNARPAYAQARGARAPLQFWGLFSMLGDTLDVTSSDAPVASRVDRTSRQVLEVKGVGFDRVVAQAVKQELLQKRPNVELKMFGTSAALGAPDQRLIADGATNGALPGWIIDTIKQQQLSHVILVTRDRAMGSAETARRDTIGRYELEGVGLHMDMDYSVLNVQTDRLTVGALIPHVIVRLTLFDVENARVQRTALINEQWLVAPDEGKGHEGPWAALSHEAKLKALHDGLRVGLRKAVPDLLGP
ncbi:MAG TPA: hypothetical protein VEZ89_09780 [Rubrivivax sp.]|nr:hypothetical protein [Rubrivivax sp.]